MILLQKGRRWSVNKKASKCKMLQKQVKCLSLSTYKLRGFAYSLALEVTQEEFEGEKATGRLLPLTICQKKAAMKRMLNK